MKQTLTAAHGAATIKTGFKLARVVGHKPKYKSEPDMREVVFYECFLSEIRGANGLEPCEYLAERSRYLLSTVKYMVNTGLNRSPIMAELVKTEAEVKYLAA